jgi:hypothetical protein
MALNKRLQAIANENAGNAPALSTDRLRRAVGYERFVARLHEAAPGEWLLKGGVALDLRFPIGTTRRTFDVDIETSTHGNLERARALLRRAVAVDLDDYFVFRLLKEPECELIEGTFAYRFGVEARLDDRVYLTFGCDVARGRDDEESERLQGRSLLGFAGIEAPSIRATRLPHHVAEKLHAYTQVRSDGILSTRAKDLVDLALIAEYREIGTAGEVRVAIAQTFARRDREVPTFLPEPSADWAIPYQRLASGLGVPTSAAEARDLVGTMLNPILSGDVSEESVWRPGEGWYERESDFDLDF